MFEIQLFDLGYCKEEYTRVVCVCEYDGKYVFSYNKKRDGWEIPGGHIEEGESWEEAAKREVYEETGATKVKIKPICVYKISSFALLCYCEILEIGELSKEFEMSNIMFSDKLPDNLSFPESHTLLFNRAIKEINNK